MGSPLGAVYSGIDSAKRKAAAFVQGMQDVGPAEVIRQMYRNRENEAGEHLETLDKLYKDDKGKPTFDPNKWSVSSKRAHDQLVDEVTSGVMGATAYHGTPYKFEKFDPKFIGQGEGAQAYGQGLYLAENPGIARGYRKDVTGSKINAKIKDLMYEHDDADEVYGAFMRDKDIPLNQKKFIAALRKDDWLGYENPAAAVREAYGKNINNYDPSPALMRQRKQMGHLYTVDVPDPQRAKFLDWDVPMVNQPETWDKIVKGSNDPDKVVLRQALDKFNERQTGNPRQLGGAAIVNALIDQAPTRSAEGVMGRQMSKALRESDIPGTKFLDYGARRGRGTTQNMVIYPGSEDMLTITERNGVQMPNINSWGSY